MDRLKRFLHREKPGKLPRVPADSYQFYAAGTADTVRRSMPTPHALETRYTAPHSAPDAYQLYEREHRVRTFDTVLAVSPTPESEAGTFTRHYISQPKPQRPCDAYELYEREHRLHTFEQVPSGSTVRRGHEAASSDNWYQKGSNMQYYHHYNDSYGAFSGENIDSKAEKFLAMRHKKFELSRCMSTNAYESYDY